MISLYMTLDLLLYLECDWPLPMGHRYSSAMLVCPGSLQCLHRNQRLGGKHCCRMC